MEVFCLFVWAFFFSAQRNRLSRLQLKVGLEIDLGLEKAPCLQVISPRERAGVQPFTQSGAFIQVFIIIYYIIYYNYILY